MLAPFMLVSRSMASNMPSVDAGPDQVAVTDFNLPVLLCSSGSGISGQVMPGVCQRALS